MVDFPLRVVGLLLHGVGGHLLSEGHELCRALLEFRIGDCTFSPSSSSLLDAAEGEDTNDCQYNTSSGGADSDFGGVGETLPFIFGLLGLAIEVELVGSIDDLDTLPASSLVAVFVFAPGGIVLRVQSLDIHGEGSSLVVGQSTSPLDCSVRFLGVSTGPDTKTDIHGGLRVVFTPIGVLILQGADDVAINDPLELLLGPDGGVVMEIVLWVIDWVVDCSVERGGVALSKNNWSRRG